jgi:hypothetical protein
MGANLVKSSHNSFGDEQRIVTILKVVHILRFDGTERAVVIAAGAQLIIISIATKLFLPSFDFKIALLDLGRLRETWR